MKKGCLIAGALGIVIFGGLMLIGLAVAAVQFGWISVPWKPAPTPVPNETPAVPVRPPADASPTQEVPAPATTPTSADPAAMPGDVKGAQDAAFRELINRTMKSLQTAMESGNFEPFYRQLSDFRKKQQPTTPEKLRAEWQAFADQRYAFDTILQSLPVLDPPPTTTADGALVLEGYYANATPDMNLTFKAWYHPQNGAWALSYMTAQMKPLAGEPPASVTPGLGNTKTFFSTKDNIPAGLKAQFVPFSFDYPESFAAAVPDQTTFVKIHKGDTVNFTVHPAAFPAGRDKEATYTATLSAISAALGKSFPSFREVSRSTETVAGVSSRTLLWQATSGNVTLYGKCYVLRKPNQRAGVFIALVSASLDPQIATAEDIGVKGDLATMVRSFKLL